MTTVPADARPVKAYNSHAASPLPSPIKSPRRVLGELTPNAKLTPHFLQVGAKSPIKTSPVNSPLRAKEACSTSAALAAKENDGYLSVGSSRKRPFSAIASPERPESTRSLAKRQQDESPQTVSPAALRSPLPLPAPVIELPEHDSSTDDDETLEDLAGHHSMHIQLQSGTQLPSGSFSSLIDYDPNDASDKSDPAIASPPPSTSATIPVTSRVELLKLRLKMAMYKINTNQTFVPFSRLEPPHGRYLQELDGDLDEQDEDAVEYASPVSRLTRTDGAAEEPTDARVQPANIIITGGPIARLLDGPVLTPTAYSTRFLAATGSPGNRAEALLMEARDEQITPAASPNKSYTGDDRDLTSSVVKGHAASGLLELAHSR